MVATKVYYGLPPANRHVLGSEAPDAITLGRLVQPEGAIGKKIRFGQPMHTLVFGPNGKGKGTRLLMPNLLQMSGCSIVVVDPKGELAAVTAPFRRKLGRVVILNPFGVLTDIRGYEDLRSQGFNPLAGLDPDTSAFNAQAALLADALVPVGGKEPHWDESARSMIAAFIMYVVLEARRLGIVPTMARVRELICEASAEPSKRNNFMGEGIPRRALEMLDYDIPGLRNKAAQFVEWYDEVRSIASTAKRHTEPFDDPEIADDLAKTGFDFGQLKREPTTVYLILPPEMMERHSKWLRLLLTSAFQSVLRVRRPGEPKVLFMIDEFYALGHLEIISTVWALTRGYGIQIVPVLQDLIQLKKLYPDLWETFIGMAGAVAAFAPNDMTTANWMARRAGDTTRQARNISSGSSQTSGWGGGGLTQSSGSSSNVSSSPVKVPLMEAHEMYGLYDGYLMLSINGLANVAPVYAPGYYDILECAERARANPYYHGS